jgi:tRNA pseudouridine13 synthase
LFSDENCALEQVYQALDLSAKLKTFAEDFIVEENISVNFSGEGEHCWLYIKKRGCNTDWVAQQLARYCGVKKMAVSYAGLKDRNAVTSQWFSVHLPGLPTPDWHDFESAFNSRASAGSASQDSIDENIQLIQNFRHNKKLQRGVLKSNTFTITLRELSNTSDKTFELLTKRCKEISAKGVANYFGPQRFGRNYSNLDQARKLFTNPRFRTSRHKRSLYLSTARSWLFNCILSERVKRHVWDKRLPGDVFMLDGRSACFKDAAGPGSEDNGESEADDLAMRLARNEIHPTSVLWGEGDAMVTADAAELESLIIDRYPVYREGLVASRLQAQRRACRVVPEQLECCRQGDDFVISFILPAGSYATVILAEIFSEFV